ncbi:site-2 protease family protein [Pengzhenrongella frigida]|uniref:Zinc metalloprotease n=1 Tax=Pengzhenrongella frigida TaxID=1259133 RepID=A0A4Q5N5A8_9MICO|nr:site-2 protease family protein [Cellulomonas sp. HLT2-17]RYV52673.1 peptidase M50 [Cellulomonas sp. HLT2-17]
MNAANAPDRRRERTAGWVIGRAAGAPVILAPSWLVAAALLTVLFAPTVQNLAPGISGVATYLVALSFVVLLFVSVFLHELAHGFVARARGLEVREFAITLWGGHTAFGGAAATPGASALIAVVGPLTNLLVGVACWFAAQALPAGSLVGIIAFSGAFANAFVAFFNLVPGLPLDGGRVLEALVWRLSGDRERGTVVAGWVGRVGAVVFAAWAIGYPFLRGEQPDLFTVGWAALIGAFLWSGASQAIRGAHAQRALDGITVATVARPAVGIRFEASLAEAEAMAVAAGLSQVVLLAPDGRPAAYIDPEAAAAVPTEARVRTGVQAVAVPLPVGAVIDGRLTGPELVRAIGAVSHFAAAMAVVVDGRVTGLVFARDVVAALRPRA